jgi:hypothetical protein
VTRFPVWPALWGPYPDSVGLAVVCKAPTRIVLRAHSSPVIDPRMTLFDHFRLPRHSSRSNPSSRSGSRAGSPTHESPHNSGHSTPIQHFASLFTHHHHNDASSSSHERSNGSHGSGKKREYEFFPHSAPIGSGGYSDVLKARWIARGGMIVAVKVVRKEAVKDHTEYLKIIGP